MVAELAREDFEDMRAEGLNPTLDDFDRLNQLALRLEDGAETTPANHPRIGWAGDVPFHERSISRFFFFRSSIGWPTPDRGRMTLLVSHSPMSHPSLNAPITARPVLNAPEHADWMRPNTPGSRPSARSVLSVSRCV